MKKLIALAAAVIVAAVIVVLAVRGSPPSHAEVVKACRAALVVNLRHNDLLSWPGACGPLSRKEVERIATQIVFGK